MNEEIEFEIKSHLKMVLENSAKDIFKYFKEKKEEQNTKTEDGLFVEEKEDEQ